MPQWDIRRELKEGSKVSYAAIGQSNDSGSLVPTRRTNWALLSASIAICMVSGPLNFILYKVMYMSYGQHGSMSVATGVNCVYVLYGGLALGFVFCRGKINSRMLSIPQSRYLAMGSLDALAGLLSATGAYATSGPLQQLLNQVLIPCTMCLSYFFLGKISSPRQIVGSLIICTGVFATLFPGLSLVSGNRSVLFAFIYMSSNIPFAASFVYKEFAFKDLKVNVILLTQLVSCYQLLIGLLQVPLFGYVEGVTLSETWSRVSQGWACFLELDKDCKSKSTMVLLLGYCAVNFIFNTSGLYLIKNGSATLNAIVAAIILPVTVLTFSLPQIGPYAEEFSSTTFLGLGLVVLGFFVWRAGEVEADTALSQDSFQERVISL